MRDADKGHDGLKRALPRWVYLAGGYGLFAIGTVGIVLPLLPTTVFWIGAAVCFAKSSPAMYHKLLTWPKLGPAIHDFLVHGIIGTNAKYAALGAMALCAIVIALISFGSWVMGLGLFGIAVGATVVLTRPSARAASGSPYRGAHGQSECPFLASVQTPFPGAQHFYIQR